MQTMILHPDAVHITLREHIGADFPRTLCGFAVQTDGVIGVTVDGLSVPFQWCPAEGKVYLHLSLAPFQQRVIEVTLGEPPAVQPSPRVEALPDATLLHTATGALRLPPLGQVRYGPEGADSFTVPAPIGAVRLDGQPWRGKGYLDTRAHIGGYACRVVESGPLFDQIEVVYTLIDGREAFRFTCTVVEGEAWARISETADLGAKSRWWLAFGEEWLPDHATLLDHTLAYTDRRLTYYKDICEARLFFWTQGSQISDFREGFGLYCDGSPEYLGWFAADGSAWQGAKTNFVEFWQRRMHGDYPLSKGEETWGANWDWFPARGNIPAQGHSEYSPFFTAESLLAAGSKHYGLLLGAREDYTYAGEIPTHDLEWYTGPLKLDEWRTLRTPLRALSIQQGLLPLDTVKEWRLAFDDGIEGAAVEIDRTHLLFEEKLKPEERAADFGRQAPEILDRMLTYLTNMAAGYLVCRSGASTNPVTLRQAAPYAFLYRDLARTGCIPAGQRARLQACYAFLGYLTSQPFFYPSHASMAPYHSYESTEPTFMGMCNQNFLTDVYATHGAIGMTLPGHPKAAQWVARFDALFNRQLDFYVYPGSGVWEESHTYYRHVLYTLLPVLFEERARGRVDWFADPRMMRLSGVLLHLLTPPDPNYNARVVAPLGDHGTSVGSATANILARGFADANPTLAANLAWMARENAYPGTLAVAPVKPAFSSEVLDGLAAIFRHEDATGESMVILRVGASWGHHNVDELSLQFYCAGEPVLVEAGYGSPGTFSKSGTSGHTMMAPVEFEPLSYLGKFNRGMVEHFDAGGTPMTVRGGRMVSMLEGVRRNGNPAAPLDIFPYRQTRELWYFPPNILIVRDRHDGVYAQQLYWHTGGRALHADGNRLRIEGHHRHATLVTFADVAYTVAADKQTFGAHGVIGKQKEVLTVIAVAQPGDPAPEVQMSEEGVIVDGKVIWRLE